MTRLVNGQQWVAHCGTRAAERNRRHVAKKETQMAGNNGKAPVPFQAPAGTPIVGQACTPLTVGVPMVMTLTCNCGPVDARVPLLIHPLAALLGLLVAKGVLTAEDVTAAFQPSAACPACRKVYSAFWNPTTGQPQVNVSTPEPDKEAS